MKITEFRGQQFIISILQDIEKKTIMPYLVSQVFLTIIVIFPRKENVPANKGICIVEY